LYRQSAVDDSRSHSREEIRLFMKLMYSASALPGKNAMKSRRFIR
jgi:hypothetical protein